MKFRLPYLNFIETELQLPEKNHSEYLVIDLFGGCGGLALGFEATGFQTIGYEILADSRATYEHNLLGVCNQVNLTPFSNLVEGAAVIIGGPPCQPFSVSGHQLGLKDSRDGFPTFISAVERYRPQIALFENVRGMLFRNKKYFEEIVLALQEIGYIVEWEILNAAHYGVPQKRERLFCVAHKGGWHWPEKTHFYSPYTAGEALGKSAYLAPPNSKFLTSSMDEYIKKYEIASKCINPRDINLDTPARTVTCRNLSSPTGDMLRIRLPDGRRRRLTVREGARLQSFPDWFQFQGSENHQFNQIGNAVPPLLAKALAHSVKTYLERNQQNLSQEFHQPTQYVQLSLELGINAVENTARNNRKLSKRGVVKDAG